MLSTLPLPLLFLTILILVVKAYRICPVFKSPGYGGPGGVPVDDYMDQYSIVGMHMMNISHGDVSDIVQVLYLLSNTSLYQAPKHGGNQSNPPIVKVINQTW